MSVYFPKSINLGNVCTVLACTVCFITWNKGVREVFQNLVFFILYRKNKTKKETAVIKYHKKALSATHGEQRSRISNI